MDKYKGIVPFVVITIRSFSHSWVITGLATIVTWWVPHVEQELLTFPEHMSSSQVLVGFMLRDLYFSV
jgi:hypothetical protein